MLNLHHYSMKFNLKYIFGISILFFIVLTGIILITAGYTIYAYVAFMDVSIILIGLTMSGYYIIHFLKENNSLQYLILASLFIMVTASHLLRLIFGGLLC